MKNLLIVILPLIAIFTILLLVRRSRRRSRESAASPGAELDLNEVSVPETSVNASPSVIEEREMVQAGLEPTAQELPVQEDEIAFRQPEIVLEFLEQEPLFTALPQLSEKEIVPEAGYSTETAQPEPEVVSAPATEINAQETGLTQQTPRLMEEIALEAEPLPLSIEETSPLQAESHIAEVLPPEPETTSQPEAGLLTEPPTETGKPMGSPPETPAEAGHSSGEEDSKKTGSRRVELYFEDGTRVAIPPDSSYYPDFLEFANRLLAKDNKS